MRAANPLLLSYIELMGSAHYLIYGRNNWCEHLINWWEQWLIWCARQLIITGNNWTDLFIWVFVNLALLISHTCNITNVAFKGVCILDVLYVEIRHQRPFKGDHTGNIPGYMTVYYSALKIFFFKYLNTDTAQVTGRTCTKDF